MANANGQAMLRDPSTGTLQLKRCQPYHLLIDHDVAAQCRNMAICMRVLSQTPLAKLMPSRRAINVSSLPLDNLDLSGCLSL